MSPARLKYTILAAVLVAAGGGILASTQEWFVIHLSQAAGHPSPVHVAGSVAAPALMALSLAGLALVGALAIAGRMLRMVLGVLGVLVGASLILAAVLTIGDPVQAGVSAVTTATGVAGDQPVAHLVTAVDVSGWPAVAVASGILLVVAAVFAAATTGRWPEAGRKYQAVKFEAADGEPVVNPRDRAIDDWDELSRGEDPSR